MFTEVQIENYKSIQSLKIGLGRVNVFIGENGCGKSNILEAIALAGAAAGNKLDNEFLAPRGIRVTEPEFMRSAFDKENVLKEIKINLEVNNSNTLLFEIDRDTHPYSNWFANQAIQPNSLEEAFGDLTREFSEIQENQLILDIPEIKDDKLAIETELKKIRSKIYFKRLSDIFRLWIDL